MKKSLLIFVLSIFLMVFFCIEASAQKTIEEHIIYTRAYNVHYDKQKKLFIIPADKEKYAVKIVFTKNGQTINFNGKPIKYKNGRFAKIGNDYISYLNGKLYTIGGKKVEIGANGYVSKIGDMTPHQYFIGEDFSPEDVENNPEYAPEMIFYIPADGSDFGGIFLGIIVPFDDVEISDGSKKEEKQYTGIDEIKHNCSYKGIPLYGKVKVVEHFGKFKVKKVDHFGDIKVKQTKFPESCGEWDFVNGSEAFTIEYVNGLEDFTIEFVNAHEGV